MSSSNNSHSKTSGPSTSDLRSAFLNFFAANGHQIQASSPITPKDDPTLLFVNAGMAPLKDYFVGDRKPPQLRMTSSQKCVRAGGKHNDLDNVGYTARHHTFFEMLGNFSFGDYFKEEAISFAWQLLTQELGIKPEKLSVTVYHTDDEARTLWKKIAGLPDHRIIPIATDDNFWSMGDTGPCGPCSEIFYDHGDHIFGGPPGSADEDGDRFVEIWNLVFMQFERFGDGRQEALPKPCIDTGSGLERVAAALQGVTSNFDTDLFQHLIQASQELTGNRDPKLIASHRVIADHLRTCAFLVAEGVLPSNEGRGYVLRRIMRRAMRHLNLLGTDEVLFYKLVPALIEVMGDHYQELGAEQTRIEHAFKGEEEQFRTTLDRGMKLLEKEVADMPSGSNFSGATAFRLYDTYGFPLDLTQDVLRGQNIEVDTDGFDTHMQAQRERARQAGFASGDIKSAPIWNTLADAQPASEFTGYDKLTDTGKLLAIVQDGNLVEQASSGSDVALLLDRTPFYAESGGQVGDVGEIRTSGGAVIEVKDTQKPAAGLHVHIGTITSGSLQTGDDAELSVAEEPRRFSAANHSSTHLMHAALRHVLGEHVSQKGSYVGPDRLRFDFSHNAPVTQQELDAIEAMVNEQVVANQDTSIRSMPLNEALETGAMAMFDEKYGDDVRVLAMGSVNPDTERNFSIELCGGTHVARGGDIGLFKILSESSVGAGVRRIEAVTNAAAFAQLKANERLLLELQAVAKSSPERLVEDVQKLVAERKRLTAELKNLRESDAVNQIANAKPEQIGDLRFIGAAVSGFAGRELKDLVKKLLSDNRADVICLLSAGEKNTGMVVGVSKAQAKTTAAKDLLNQAFAAAGGGSGGGSPTLAQGASGAVLDDAANTAALNNIRESLS